MVPPRVKKAEIARHGLPTRTDVGLVRSLEIAGMATYATTAYRKVGLEVTIGGELTLCGSP